MEKLTSAVSIPKYFEPEMRRRSIKIRDMSVMGAGRSWTTSCDVLFNESFLCFTYSVHTCTKKTISMNENVHRCSSWVQCHNDKTNLITNIGIFVGSLPIHKRKYGRNSRFLQIDATIVPRKVLFVEM